MRTAPTSKPDQQIRPPLLPQSFIDFANLPRDSRCVFRRKALRAHENNITDIFDYAVPQYLVGGEESVFLCQFILADSDRVSGDDDRPHLEKSESNRWSLTAPLLNSNSKFDLDFFLDDVFG